MLAKKDYAFEPKFNYFLNSHLNRLPIWAST